MVGHSACVCGAEQSKVDLMREMEERAANSDQVRTLQSNIDAMTTELAQVSTKLQEAAVQLNKEKARNKAVSEHTSVSYSRLPCLFGFFTRYIIVSISSKVHQEQKLHF